MAPYSWRCRRSTARRLVPSVRVRVCIDSLVPRVHVAEVTSHPLRTDTQIHTYPAYSIDIYYSEGAVRQFAASFPGLPASFGMGSEAEGLVSQVT